MERLVSERVSVKDEFDVIVAGGGLAGVAAALSAKRMGKRVLLIEKSTALGGLATIGLINLFVPMCNGRGKQIIKGMAEEFLRLSIQYGYDTLPEDWKNGEPDRETSQRYITRFSPAIFALVLAETLVNEGVEILYDTIITRPWMDGMHCDGLIAENKTGRVFYSAKIVIDTTGDADILYRAGVPTMQGKNFFTMISLYASLESAAQAVESGDISMLIRKISGGEATLHGKNHPDGMKTFTGTNAEDVTDFLLKNQLKTLNSLKQTERTARDVLMLPAMAQFRTTRCLIGDDVFSMDNVYRHCETSIGAICDFERRDYLYEIPYGALVKTGYDNLITAGRTASAKPDYSWDILRVIPPAILTGQAAGIAAAIAVDSKKAIYSIDVAQLQNELQKSGVMIHFDDALVPVKEAADIAADDIDHI